jgi:hypothetical protein
MLMDIDADAAQAKFEAMKVCADEMIAAATGFSRQPWIKRAGAGHCVHIDPITGVPYLHITSGWNYATQSLPGGHWRTKDFVTCERATEPINVLPATFSEMASFNGRLFRCNGLWDYPFSQPNSTHTTDKVFMSDTGAFPWQLDLNAPSQEGECGMAVVSGGYLYTRPGENYRINSPPTYNMPTAVHRRDANGVWTESGSTPARRSFAYLDWNGKIVLIGGRDDTNYPAVADLNDMVVSSDGFATSQRFTGFPFRGAYGRRATIFNGRLVLTGGAYGQDGLTANTVFLKEVWSASLADDITDPASWRRDADLPTAVAHHVVATLSPGGLETMGVIGGYNSVDRPGGSPSGRIDTTTDLETWTLRTDSDFCVA